MQLKIAKTTRETKPFHLYLISLKSMWDELAPHRPLIADIEILKQRIEDKIFKLLAEEYDHIKSMILMTNPLSSLNNVLYSSGDMRATI